MKTNSKQHILNAFREQWDWMQPWTTEKGIRFGYWGSGGTGEKLKVKKPIPPTSYKCSCGKEYGTKQGLKVHKGLEKKLEKEKQG